MSVEVYTQASDNPVIDHLDFWSSVYVKKASTGRGSNGKVSPYGIQKLRELILELAVRGKLVAQEPKDEPASVLLQRAVEQKAALIKAKMMRKTKVPAPYDDELGDQLPQSWVWTTLYELGEIGPRNRVDDEQETAFVPMERISGRFGVPVDYEVRVWKDIKTGFTHFKDNDVALAKITPCFQNGKSAVMRGLKNGVGAGTTELHIFRSITDTVSPDYVLLFLKSPGFILDGIPKMTGTAGQKRITRDYFAGKPFPLPPLAEQHRIVDKIDELMALCDQLEQQQTDSLQTHQTLVETLLRTLVEAGSAESTQQAWNRIAEHFDTLFTTEESTDQLKQTILQLAVRGKLVPQNTHDVQVDATSGVDSDSPFGIPESWKWTSVGDFADTRLGKMLDKAKNKGKPARYLRNINVRWFDFDLTDVKEMRFEDFEHEEFSLRSGDVLICEGGYPGRAAVWDEREADIYFQKALHRVRLPESVSPYYFVLVLRESVDTERIKGYFTGAGIQHFTGKGLKSFLAPLPPIAEQHRIVAKVDELIDLCDALKNRIQEAQTTQVHLADAVVEEAIA